MTLAERPSTFSKLPWRKKKLINDLQKYDVFSLTIMSSMKELVFTRTARSLGNLLKHFLEASIT